MSKNPKSKRSTGESNKEGSTRKNSSSPRNVTSRSSETSLRIRTLKSEQELSGHIRAHQVVGKTQPIASGSGSGSSPGSIQRQTSTSKLSTITATTSTSSLYADGLEGRSAKCVQCHTPNVAFYCALCLSERIISHHTNVRRVDEMRQKEKDSVIKMMGIEVDEKDGVGHTGRSVSENHLRNRSLSDPFKDNDLDDHEINEMYIDQRRMLRAKGYSLIRGSEEAKARTTNLRREIEKKRERVQQFKENQAKRRALLEKARKSFTEATLSIDGIHCQQQMISPSGLDLLRKDIEKLLQDGKESAQRLAETRAILAREAFALFMVRPPSGTLAGARAEQGKSTWSGLPSRSNRSKERYIPGAFVFDQRTAKRAELPAENLTKDAEIASINPNDWKIMDLVLPVYSDVKRFDCQKINGAISHTVHLLQLLTSYLGIRLPFLLSNPSGTPSIRPNELWGSGTKQSLHLSTSTYNVLSANESPSNTSGLGSMGASMISNLGASTISTIESFVQLPSAKNLPWSKNAPTADAKDHVQETTRKECGNSTRTGMDEKTSMTTKQFSSALTMLRYDIAYLAFQEGIHIDISHAAGSMLRLLSKMINSRKLGERAHTTSFADYHIDDLIFQQLDFAQLSQVNESGITQLYPLKSGGRKSNQSEGSTNKSKEAQRRSTKAIASSFKQSVPEMLDGSYIDARQAAQSILDIRIPNPDSKKDKEKQILNATYTKSSSLATASRESQRTPERAKIVTATNTTRVLAPVDRRISADRTGTLDFLRLPSQRDEGGVKRTLKSSAQPNGNEKDEGKRVGVDGLEKSRKEGKKDEHVSKVSSKPRTSPTSQQKFDSSTKADSKEGGGGKVVFNGIEVKGKTAAGLGRRNSVSKQTSPLKMGERIKQEEDEDGWAVL